METARAYEEIVDFIASGTSPAAVISFRPSSHVKARVAFLIEQEKTIGLSPDEKSELDHYSQMKRNRDRLIIVNRDGFLSTDFGLREFAVKGVKERLAHYRRFAYE